MFGFFSFNGAANAKVSSYEDRDVVERAIINTMIGGTSSGLVTLLSFMFSARKKWSLLSTINGILSGGKQELQTLTISNISPHSNDRYLCLL